MHKDHNEIVAEYLTLAELAIYASACRNTLKKWIKRGMPYYKVDRSVRVRISEFNDWMNQFRVGTSKDLDAVWDQVMREV
jgi:excisionase family DNA binding protein